MFTTRFIPAFLICVFFLSFTSKSFSQCTEVVITSSTSMYGWEMSWELYNDAGDQVANFQGVNNDEVTESTICVPDGCYTLIALDSYGDGWNGGVVEMVWDGASINFGMPQGEEYEFVFGINQAGCAPIVLGCTNANAFNYDPNATEDDGSCQTLADIIAAQVVDTLCYSGPKDNRINWVIQNRSEENPNNNFIDAADLSNLLNENLISTFTYGDPQAQSPYAEYKNFFNIYASWWPDAPGDHTWWGFNVIQTMRDEIFLPWANDETGWVTWFSLSKYGGGGGAGLDREARVGDGKMWGADDYETLLHEFGHTMPGLIDEYTASGEWSGGQCWESGNSTSYTIKDSIPWRKWITDDIPLPTPYNGDYEEVVGAFEGGLTNYFGCHRPTAKGCYMGAGGFGEGYGRDLCSPCVQRVICFLYQYVNVIEDPSPSNPNLSVTGAETLTFSADVITPIPNTQKYEWFLNGKLVGEGVTSIELTFGHCDNYELKFAVTDTTELVRYDEKFDDIYPKPYREFVWNIEQEDVNSYDLGSSADITDASCTGDNDGVVELSINGGLAPYEVWLEGTAVSNPAFDLEPGDHLFTVVDANGCAVNEAVQVGQADLLDLEICSSHDGSWEVSVNSENYDPASLDLLWSTGATDPVISGLSDGNYSLTATINGCSVTENFELITSPDVLSVANQYFPSESGGATGAIYINTTGGAPAYQIEWYERIGVNPTGPFLYNPEYDGHFSRSNLAPGEYRYEVSDASSACADGEIEISAHSGFTASGLTVVQDGNCGVAIEFPDPDYDYYWLSDEQGSELLGSGTSFEPPFEGNFYVAAANNNTNGWSSNRKGFAVTMPEMPQVEDLGNGTLAIVDPQPDEVYHWYDMDNCGTPIHIGNSFTPPSTPTQYYISAKSNITYPAPIDPASVQGLILRMDAADLDGDGMLDDPAPATSSLLDWYFPTGNQWTENWFAYRSNHQNGLGIVDWATIWLQRIDEGQSGFQSVIMAYDENELSWENTAPFEALSELMPRHEDPSQIYADDAPASTLNGSTFLNGQEVNPLSTANPMEFCVLGSTFTSLSNLNVFWTDTHWEGKVGEILFYDNALSDEEMRGVSEFLRQKWISTAELESPRTAFQWGTVSTEQVDDLLQVTLSPNPTTDVIFLQSNTTESLSIEVFDLQGRLIFSQSSFISSVRMDVSAFASGLYHVAVVDKERKRVVLRFLKL